MRLIHKDLFCAFSSFIWLVTGEVNKVHRAWAGKKVDSGQENQEGRADNHRNQVVLEMLPKIIEILK